MGKIWKQGKIIVLGDTCELKGCGAKAKHIGSLPESGIIDMCSDCYNKFYRS